MYKILISGGGTTGHIHPALAIAEIIKKKLPETEFLYVGTPNSLEERIAKREGYNFEAVTVTGFGRKLSPKNIKRNAQSAYNLLKADKRCRDIISEFAPDLAIGTGGYVCGPIIRAAAKMGIPTALHEQNAFPGMTVKLLSANVDEVMLAFSDASERLSRGVKYTVTGLPTRAAYYQNPMRRTDAKHKLGFDDSLCILSFGGSLGANTINNIAADLIKFEETLPIKINHIHAYGKNGIDTFTQGLTEAGIDYNGSSRLMIREYIDNMNVCMSAADIVICRSGASTVFELQALGRASILIPSPNVTENHQYYNACVIGKTGGAIVMEEKDIETGSINKIISEFVSDTEKIRQMEKDTHSGFEQSTPEKIFKCIEFLLNGRNIT
ncbi:MAG: UDP-N-acetylglucosamine--N-acetylmuramyl-(pentapeptide) pyrophosphoryl-undecaprenol N-acetylglucosamine transferase [Ruminococcus sp.]|jgi:UDP-N-acetylglucosamine--N-acetylmuramyl-(pentapeptide) pyrophosphoryl-undecaprenol N-acetylglucosamine transferase|nr:UDP-N-acetylglucosamine--N-acetylmuramyl-(pentapeptide) pyrophosphoryl-undecaprenol N-acetylglucosamine transferase [Ruminococcus sp.]